MVTVHVKSHCICIFRGAIPILGELDSFTFLVLYRMEYRHLKELLVSFLSRLRCSCVKTLEVLFVLPASKSGIVTNSNLLGVGVVEHEFILKNFAVGKNPQRIQK